MTPRITRTGELVLTPEEVQARLDALEESANPRVRLRWEGRFGYYGLFRCVELRPPQAHCIDWWWLAWIPTDMNRTRIGCGYSEEVARKQAEQWLAMEIREG